MPKMQTTIPTLTPDCQRYLNAFNNYKDLLKNLESYNEKELESQETTLLLIGQLITDIDDKYNLADRPDDWKQYCTAGEHLFYEACSSTAGTDYFQDPYIIYLIHKHSN